MGYDFFYAYKLRKFFYYKCLLINHEKGRKKLMNPFEDNWYARLESTLAKLILSQGFFFLPPTRSVITTRIDLERFLGRCYYLLKKACLI